MELSATRPNRLANGCLGAVPAAACIAYATQATTPLPRLVACVLAVVSALLAGRGYRLGVTCSAGRLTVRGYLRTRVIPRERVVAVTAFPGVRWVGPSGRARWTPVTAFVPSPGENTAARERKESAVAWLRRWAAAGEVPHERRPRPQSGSEAARGRSTTRRPASRRCADRSTRSAASYGDGGAPDSHG